MKTIIAISLMFMSGCCCCPETITVKHECPTYRIMPAPMPFYGDTTVWHDGPILLPNYGSMQEDTTGVWYGDSTVYNGWGPGNPDWHCPYHGEQYKEHMKTCPHH